MKPPYRVPTMTEIRALPWNGRVVVSTFAGGGGSSTGYRMAGYRVLWANEFIPAAQDTYRANKADYTVLDGRDIRTVQASEIEAAIGRSGREIDIFDGSPPCAAFSTAGKREAGWGKVKAYSDTKQRVDDLFFEYARLLKDLQPRTFVAENVSGLVKGTAKGYFLEILAALKACGYRVKAQVLDAQWLGVPQSRQRLIFVGVRDDLGLEPVHPKPWGFRYSLKDACPNILYQGDNGGFGGGCMRASDHPSGAFGAGLTTGNGTFPPSVVSDGGGSVLLDPETGSKLYVETASKESKMHVRRMTLGELRRVGGFPPDYVLTGDFSQRWERVGRAVPPLMMKAIATAVYEGVLCRLPS